MTQWLNLRKCVEIVLSISFAAVILYWMYSDFPFEQVAYTLQNETHWDWLLFSLIFGIIPQILRGMRWRMALEPLGEKPSLRNCISAVYMSFAASLVIPRIGEISRCATLKKTDGTSFPTAIGTVVTERLVDSLLVLLILGITFICEIPAFIRFFNNIGLQPETFFQNFSVTGCIISILCTLLIAAGLAFGIYKLRNFTKFQDVMHKFTQGIISVRKIRHTWLYLLYSVIIWLCYFLHFYVAFYAFDFTSHLSMHAGLIAFCMITVAVLVPTPNGAGPWHFAVKVVLIQFGIAIQQAILFALIVHAAQTLLVILLGVYGFITLKTKKHIQTIK